MAKIHDRMAVILTEDARDRWLDPTASEAENFVSFLSE